MINLVWCIYYKTLRRPVYLVRLEKFHCLKPQEQASFNNKIYFWLVLMLSTNWKVVSGTFHYPIVVHHWYPPLAKNSALRAFLFLSYSRVKMLSTASVIHQKKGIFLQIYLKKYPPDQFCFFIILKLIWFARGVFGITFHEVWVERQQVDNLGYLKIPKIV